MSMKKMSFHINVTFTDKQCPKHHIPLVTYGNLKPFCTECIKEKMEREKQQAIDQFKYDQIHGYLRSESLTDRKTVFDCTFANYDPHKASWSAKYRNAAVRIAKDYADNPDKKFNTIFFGKAGTGKTHLAMAILNYFNGHSDQKCVFLSIPKLLQANKDWFKDSINNFWSQKKTVEVVSNANLVVIDDLGAESADGNASSFVQSVVFQIYEANQRIITTTNLTKKQIRETYDPRLLSRIEEHAAGHVLDFDRLPDERVKA